MKRGRPVGSKFPKEYRLRLSNEDFDKLKEISKISGVKISAILRKLIKEFIEKWEATK